VDEKVLEEIQFHTETVASDANSPLHLIREKEMEISGRVLAAKKHAEEIVAEARRSAVAVLQEAQEEGSRLSAEREVEVRSEIERETLRIFAQADGDVAALEEAVRSRFDTGVDFIVGAVVRGKA